MAVGCVMTVSACTIDVGDRGTPTTPSAEQEFTTAPADPAPAEGTHSAAPTVDSPVDSVVVPGGAIAIHTGDGASQAGQVDMPAWSSIKVPLAIAALRENPGLDAQVTAAITQSSNADADSLWNSLGTPDVAAHKTQQVLAEGDSPATVPAAVTRPGFSAFGQTQWSLADQARFASNLSCIAGSAPVLAAMGNIAAGQSYGLGNMPGAKFKGGWGPDESGSYQVRQFGLVPVGEGQQFIAVSLAAAPADGTYESGQAMLNQMANNLLPLLGQMKPVSC